MKKMPRVTNDLSRVEATLMWRKLKLTETLFLIEEIKQLRQQVRELEQEFEQALKEATNEDEGKEDGNDQARGDPGDPPQLSAPTESE